MKRLRFEEGHPVPPRQSGTLTEAELRIMNVLWGKGSGTVQQVLDSIIQKPALAYNSVLTTIRVLERKGYLKHLKDGRAHVYTPLVGQEEATRSEIRHLVSRFFKNSHEQLVLNLLEDQGIGPEEIACGRCWFIGTRFRRTRFGAARNELARPSDNDADRGADLGRAPSQCAP
jgi:predicted transcriptional regulator